jgi:hypothetical protein
MVPTLAVARLGTSCKLTGTPASTRMSVSLGTSTSVNKGVAISLGPMSAHAMRDTLCKTTGSVWILTSAQVTLTAVLVSQELPALTRSVPTSASARTASGVMGVGQGV